MKNVRNGRANAVGRPRCSASRRNPVIFHLVSSESACCSNNALGLVFGVRNHAPAVVYNGPVPDRCLAGRFTCSPGDMVPPSAIEGRLVGLLHVGPKGVLREARR